MVNIIKKYKNNIIAIVISLFIALVIVEVAVRIFFPESRDHIIPGGLFNMDKDLGWSFNKGEQSRHQSRAFDVKYKINSLGYRDSERVTKKKSGLKRVLVYGDSQVFGWGLPVQDRYTNLLENRLDNIEVWNLAVPAYGLDQELLSFERNAKDFSPDVVVFLASQSTLGRTRYGYNYKKYKPQFVKEESGKFNLIPVPESNRVLLELLYKSIGWLYIPYFIEIRIEMFKSQFETKTRRNEIADPLREINKHILIRAKRSVAALGAKMVVIGELPDSKRKEMDVFSKEYGFTFIPYELKGPIENWILAPTDHHYNLKASTAIADQLEPVLKKLLN